MAFLFGKNKKKKEDADASVSMNTTTDIVDTSETQRTIAANRTVRQEIDDALDAFGCHGIGGIFGGIVTGFFTTPDLALDK